MPHQKSRAERQHHIRQTIARRRRQVSDRDQIKAIREGLVGKLSAIDNADLIDDLVALGFTADTVGVLPYMPMIQMAWADGGVTTAEAASITERLKRQGVAFNSPAYRLIDLLLTNRPSEEFLESCALLLRDLYASLPGDEAARARESLLGFAQVVAESSGGFLGLGSTISNEERALLDHFHDIFSIEDVEAMHRSLVEAPSAKASAEALRSAPPLDESAPLEPLPTHESAHHTPAAAAPKASD